MSMPLDTEPAPLHRAPLLRPCDAAVSCPFHDSHSDWQEGSLPEVLICVPPTIGDVEHFFLGLLLV